MIKDISNYWTKTAAHDYETMFVLYKAKRYSDSLFFGHIVLEKILKALAVQHTRKQAPYIHDLVRLQELAKISLTDEEVDLLDSVNNFNIKSRYPEYKLLFYKTCTKKYTEKYLFRIDNLYKKLCQTLR